MLLAQGPETDVYLKKKLGNNKYNILIVLFRDKNINTYNLLSIYYVLSMGLCPLHRLSSYSQNHMG